MSEEGWRRVAIILAVVLALIIGFGAALVLFRGGGTGATATPTGSATASASASESPSESPSGSPSLSPSPSASPSPTRTPIPTSPATSITFVGLKLDSPADSKSQLRRIDFQSDGPGDILVTAKVTSPLGMARICLRVDTQAPTCKLGGGTIKHHGTTGDVSNKWSVTAIGNAIDTPQIDLTITWPTAHPKITFSNFRFDGTVPDPAYNGFTATLKARTDGSLALNATWGGKPFPWDFLAQDNTDSSKTQEPMGTGTGVALALPAVKAHDYRLTLQNTSSFGAGAVYMAGSLSWP